MITYDGSGRAQTVTQPAPTSGAARPERGYCFGSAQASFSGGTLACASPVPNTTAVAVAGLSPTVGYVEQVRYDARNRITATRDTAGLATNYLWDNHDRLVSSTTPAGVETSSGYDSQGHQVNSFGPAPSASFHPDGTPISGQGVATATTAYDGSMSGLAGAWYSNTNLSGSPAYHTLAPSSESWSGGGSPGGPIPSSGFSGQLNGLVTVPTNGQLTFDGDGGQILLDGHPYINQMGGPYPAQVQADHPADWWRLGENTGATLAVDSAGNLNGIYSGGVTLGQTGPLADGDSTATTFNGTNGYVSLPSGFSWLANGFSIDAWIDPTAAGSWQRVVEFGTGASTNSVYLALGPTGQDLALGIWNNGTGQWAYVNSIISLNVWQHVAVTFTPTGPNSGTAYFYLNGVQEGTYNFTIAPARVTYTQNAIAKSNWSTDAYFTGGISDVAVYPDVLAGTRIAAHHNQYNLTSTTTTGPVIYDTPYPTAVNADAPNSYWRLGDPSGTTATDSNGPNPGTYSSGVTLAQRGGLVGDTATSALFNGSSGYVTLPSGFSWLANGFSIDAWIDPTAAGSWQRVIEFGTGASTNNVALALGPSGQDLALGLWNSGTGQNFVVSNALTLNQWQHVAVSFTVNGPGNGSATLYRNGVQLGTQHFTITPADTIYTQNAIGQSNWSSDAHFSGYMSDIAVYSQPLDSQFNTHYQAGVLAPYPQAVQSDTPVSMWRLAEGNGTTASDLTGPNNGTYTSATLGGAGPLAGNPDSSANFNGTTGNVTVSDNADLEFANNQAFSLEAWVKTTVTSGSEAIVSKMANAAPYQGWELGLTNGAPYLYLINTWNTNAILDTANTTLADGNWHHLAVTYDGSSKGAGVTFYIDGRPVTDTINNDNLTGSSISTATLNIASRANSALFFNGSIGDVAVYPAALTAGQVALHYQAGQTNPGPGPYATVHTLTVEDQQFPANGHLNITSSASGTTFDPNYGLATQTTDADGKVTATSYTDSAHGIGPQFGLPTSVTQNPGGLNLITRTTYETPGSSTYLRVLSKTLPAGNGPSYTYYGNTAGPIAAVCGVTSTTSQAGALQQETDPAPASGSGDARVQQYVYDVTGRQVGIRVGTVNTISSAGWECTTFDAAGRVSSQSYPTFGNAAARTVTYNYAVGNNPMVNNVTDTNWGPSTISATVDLLDRVTSYSDIWGNTTATTYDQAGRTTGTAGPQGNLTYSFDATTGRPTTTVLGSATLSSAGYDSYGRLNQVNVAGTTTGETVSYDTNGRQSSETITSPSVGTTGGSAQTYSAAGRVATQQVYANGSLHSPQSLTYDSAGRLTQAVLPSETYNYSYASTSGCPQNSAGADTNRTGLTLTQGNTNTTTNYCYDNADRLTSTTSIASGQIVYDGHGNMTQEGGEAIAYDSSDQLSLDDGPGYFNLYKRDPLNRVAQVTDYSKVTARSTSTATVTIGSSISISQPSGAQSGDTLIGSITTTAQNGLTAPTGWTVVASTTNGGHTTWALTHQVTGSDPSSWGFSVNIQATNIVGSIVDYYNTTGSPIDVSATANDASGTTQPLPRVTTTGQAETLVHVVGYNGDAVATAPSGDTQRTNTGIGEAALLVTDRYQEQPGLSTAVSATSTLAFASEAITVALFSTNTVDRLGYTGQTDSSGFTQNSNGTTIGTSVALAGGITYDTTPSGATYSFANQHGDVIETTDAGNNRTWDGYWAPYGELPSGVTAPSDTAVPGGTYGYNGAQGKLTEGDLILMGARPYSPADGRFTQPDPIEGGCANDYTYAFGDPLNHPDLSGEGGCHKHHHHWWQTALEVAGVAVGAVGVVGFTVATFGVGDAFVAAVGEVAAEGTGVGFFEAATAPAHLSFVLGPYIGGAIGFGALYTASLYNLVPAPKKACK